MKMFNHTRASICLLLIILCQSKIYSQCPNGVAASVISYDTVFRGGGNTVYDVNVPQFDTSKVYLNFPQFEPSKGTLIGVDIQTFINVKNSYKLENQDNVPTLSRIKIIRSDIINSSVLVAPFDDTKNKVVAINILAPNDGMNGAGADYVEAGPLYPYNKYKVDYNLTNNLAGFLGTGVVLFNYETITDLYSSGSNNLFTSVTEDSISFRLTYRYCTTALLPADISNFNAIKQASGNLQLSWQAPNDYVGNKYEIQKSLDGNNYNTFETVIATSTNANSYQIRYTPVKDDKDKILFRIKQFNTDGSIKYSTVKTVSLDYASTAMKVYPTVARTSVNIYFRYAMKSDYQVSIISLTGQVMQQSEYLRTNLINLPLIAGIKPGLYLVCVVNKQTLERQQSKLVIE